MFRLKSIVSNPVFYNKMLVMNTQQSAHPNEQDEDRKDPDA
jgi:hypothetical protein